MRVRDLRRAGHLPSLLAALGHFEVSFMVWVLLGAVGVTVAEQFGLSPTAKGVMVGLPLVAGSAFRVLVGALADRFGPKRVGMVSMLVVLLPLGWGWLGANRFGEVLAIGLLLGVAGASFAVALPLASRSYPPEYQGLAMGIAGAGNSGTVLATLLAPRLAAEVGWHGVFGLAMLPVAAMAAGFALLARDVPGAPQRARGSRARLARDPALLRLCAFYLVTFGGYVGLVSFLPILYHDQFAQAKLQAANLTALAAATGSFLRPLGGLLADRVGGLRVLSVLYGAVALLALGAALLPPLPLAAALLVALLGCLGMGNGAVFQVVPQRFGADVGAATGIVGAAGGLGGFLLPYGLGALKDLTGSYGAGLAALGLAALAALALARWVAQDAPRRIGAPAPALRPAPAEQGPR